MNWYLDVLKTKYATFDGRARRQEFWMFTLFNFIISIVLSLVDTITGLSKLTGGLGVLSLIYGLAVFIPGLAVAFRRLHDIGKSAWYILMGLIPCAGPFILIYYYVQDSEPGSNQFGPNPKGVREEHQIGAQ